MALRKTITVSGTEYVNAYHRIATLAISARKQATVKLSVSCYATKKDSDDDKSPIRTRAYNISTFNKSAAENALAMAYAWLKELGEYAGSADA